LVLQNRYHDNTLQFELSEEESKMLRISLKDTLRMYDHILQQAFQLEDNDPMHERLIYDTEVMISKYVLLFKKLML
jgi:hypothetical protein